MIREFLWRIVARIVTIPAVTDWLIARAQRTPYTHITGPNGSLYMGRWWLFNPYQPNSDGAGRKWAEWLPSVRVHHIRRADGDRHLHDHPWNARTIILRGWYSEERPCAEPTYGPDGMATWPDDEAQTMGFGTDGRWRATYTRERGYTGRLLFGQYHRIAEVPAEGVWTLFITWKKQGTWGFLVDGAKVPWRKYLGIGEGA